MEHVSSCLIDGNLTARRGAARVPVRLPGCGNMGAARTGATRTVRASANQGIAVMIVWELWNRRAARLLLRPPLRLQYRPVGLMKLTENQDRDATLVSRTAVEPADRAYQHLVISA